MIKIIDLIATLQGQVKKHGNIDLTIEVTLHKSQWPKDRTSKHSLRLRRLAFRPCAARLAEGERRLAAAGKLSRNQRTG